VARQALTATYVKTVQLRHSLVHRAAFTDPSRVLVGHNEQGNHLRPVTPEEREAFDHRLDC
jgi:hypothetical protein